MNATLCMLLFCQGTALAVPFTHKLERLQPLRYLSWSLHSSTADPPRLRHAAGDPFTAGFKHRALNRKKSRKATFPGLQRERCPRLFDVANDYVSRTETLLRPGDRRSGQERADDLKLLLHYCFLPPLALPP